jgi:hypothetical protein
MENLSQEQVEELQYIMSKWKKPLEQQPPIIQRWVKRWIKHHSVIEHGANTSATMDTEK